MYQFLREIHGFFTKITLFFYIKNSRRSFHLLSPAASTNMAIWLILGSFLALIKCNNPAAAIVRFSGVSAYTSTIVIPLDNTMLGAERPRGGPPAILPVNNNVKTNPAPFLTREVFILSHYSSNAPAGAPNVSKEPTSVIAKQILCKIPATFSIKESMHLAPALSTMCTASCIAPHQQAPIHQKPFLSSNTSNTI